MGRTHKTTPGLSAEPAPQWPSKTDVPGQEPGAVERILHQGLWHTRGVLNEKSPAALPELLERIKSECGDALLGDPNAEKILTLFDELERMIPFGKAAATAGFTSNDLAVCPPARKARIVLQSLLEEYGPAGKQLWRRFEELLPRYIPKDISIEASWVQECQKQKNFGGRCWKMETGDPKILTIALDTDTRQIVASVPNNVSASSAHQQAVQKTIAKLQTGELNILKSLDAQTAGLKVEPYGNKGRYLLCLHCLTNSRIYGVYDNKTGILRWEGFADDHKKWDAVMKNFR